MNASDPQPTPPPLKPARLPLARPNRGRVLCGVCRGVALHVGAPVWVVRLLFVIAACAFGAGVVSYAFLWVMMPSGDPVAIAQRQARDATISTMPIAKGIVSPDGKGPGREDAGKPGTDDSSDERDETSGDATGSESLADAIRRAPASSLIALAGVALIALCAVLLATGTPVSLIAPIMLAMAAVGAAWLHVNDPALQMRSLLVGVALLVAAVALFAVTNFREPDDMLRAVLAVVATLAAVGLMMVPWMMTMTRRLGQEQASKEREEERADMAAHLHDGVLQTLALIQLHSNEPQTVFTLARSQERELREWLYQERTTSDRSVSAGVKELAARIEDEHGKPVEVVTVGDARPSAQTDALLDATAQALLNAVTHGDEPISVYCEAQPGTAGQPGKVEMFVRDHGSGFDVDAIPPDRLGIRESIIGRIQRRGGTVEIVSRPGWGTEVRMHMPVGAQTTGKENA